MTHFKTIRDTVLGKRSLRLVSVADGRIGAQGSDEVQARRRDEGGKSDPAPAGFAAARRRFLRFFPDGFASPSYASRERDHKLAAKTKLDLAAPLSRALDGHGFGEAILSAVQATTLLSPFEKPRLQALVRGPHGDAFVRAAARFTRDPDAANLAALDRVLTAQGCASWPIATYLPFLWRPEVHMFLKADVTKDYASRVGHPFASLYRSRLSFDVYAALLDMARETRTELADLDPRDHIDIQSFVWIVGAYRDLPDPASPRR